MLPRKIYKKVKKYINTQDVLVLHGARQVGKTSLMKIIMKDLNEGDYCYFDLEDSRFQELCEGGVERIITYLKQRDFLKKQKRFFLLIDEIQYLSNPSSLLKLIHDHHPVIKLIVSGSSSFNIKKKFKDSLVGRTVNFEIFPLDFEEFLLFRNKRFNFSKKITDPVLQKELAALYHEYILYGGYPKITLTDSIEIKETYLQQIIDTYIKKDIRDLANIRDIRKFNNLLQVLAGQSGQLLNITELSNTTRLAKQTVEEYLFILENTYIIKLVQPFSTNLRSELFKTPKIFFYDTGILNLLWLKALPKQIIGNIFETALFSDLVKNRGKDAICYWRTQDKKEIDFVLREKQTLIPIEIKYNANSFSPTAIRYFSNKYNPDHSFCVCLEGQLSKKKSDIRFLKPWDLLTI